jgi:broad specificity phosphatase PhoE
MKITLVRHAEVEERYQNCYNGHNDIGLSNNGKLQAKELAKKLDMSEFDAVFCSDLRRAKETLRHSLHPKSTSSLSLTAHVKETIFTDRLREKSWGRHEGMSYDEIVAKEKIEYIDFLQWIKALDGEPYEEYIKRVKEFFLDYLPSLNKENILVVTHSGVIRVLLSIINGITLEEAFSIKIENASLVKVELKVG